MNDKLKKLALNRKVESGSIGNTMHVVLLLCNGACNVNKGSIYKILFSWWWALCCSKHVEKGNK